MSQENVEMVRRGYGHWIATGEFTPELAGTAEVVGEDLALEALDHQRATPLIGQEAPGEGAEAIEVSNA
jgi:hypothetical protein